MYYVYILTNQTNSMLYIGITNDIKRRLIEHQSDINDGFTKKYKTHKLVYFEEFKDSYQSILREKQLKKWRRSKKNELIERMNPVWEDLSEGVFIRF